MGKKNVNEAMEKEPVNDCNEREKEKNMYEGGIWKENEKKNEK